MAQLPLSLRAAAPSASAAARTSAMLDRLLLACGGLAGPLYLIVGLAQALTRPGFDLTRHDLSLLSNGDLGWIQIGNFLLSGLLVLAGALGMRRSLRPHAGPGAMWGPRLVAGYGLGLIGAGIFVADPALGFPPGTPVDATAISAQGLLHFVTGGTGFLALIGACAVFTRRFAALHHIGWARFTALTGVVFLAGFFGIAAGSGNHWTILGFWVALVLAWSWLTVLSLRLMSKPGGN